LEPLRRVASGAPAVAAGHLRAMAGSASGGDDRKAAAPAGLAIFMFFAGENSNAYAAKGSSE